MSIYGARMTHIDNRAPILNQAANQHIYGDTYNSYIGVQSLTDGRPAKIYRWLSAPDPSSNYEEALKQRQANTGVWFLESEQYAKWKTDAASFLWLYGIPGCGKTILSSTILQNVFQYCADDTGKIVAYFYFNFNDSHKQDPELMVRSLISQLSQRSVKLLTILETLYSSCENRCRHPSLDDFLEVLHKMIQESPQSYIILDALDECGECDKRDELMDVLKRMAGWRLESLHILVTSRKERDIESSLEDFVDEQNTICLQSKLVDKDIHTYIRQKLSNDKSLKKWQKFRQEIETTLMKGAHGMFQWAVLQLDRLRKCRNELQLRESLATLPPTLDQTYDRILCAIRESDSEYAVRILRWLAFSTRPLLVEEISEVIAINPKRDPAFDRQEVLQDPLDVLDICSSLVTIADIAAPEEFFLQMGRRGSVSTRKVVLLAHYSVKEYLISARCRQDLYRMENAACNEFIAKSCLKYLLQFQSPVSFTDESIEESKLARYSAEFWATHVQKASHKAEALNQLVMELFLTGNGAYLNWIRIYDPDKPEEGCNVTRQSENVPTPLYYASLLGLTRIVSLLILETGADSNAQGGRCGSALQAASAGGHDQVIQQLLEKGADVNAQGGFFGSALQAALARGHFQVAQQLLGKGADVNARGGEFIGSALQAASVRGHDQIVQWLLEKGADVNAQGGFFGSALQAASAGAHDQIVQRLLEKGADVNVRGGKFFGSALQAASARGHDQIVQRLLEKGADVNVQGGFFGSALQVASAGGHDQIVQRLLEKGADINAQGGECCGSALEAASAGGHDQIVQRLLEKGADVNVQGGGRFGSALQAASAGGHDQIVQRLLEKGADVNARGGFFGSALQAASARSHDQIVQRLLKKGANANAQGARGGGFFGSGLQAALKGAHNQVAQQLLEKVADVRAQGGGLFGSALQAASAEGHDQVVQRLLEKGVDVNAQGGFFGSALQAASARGHDQVVQRLKSAIQYCQSPGPPP